MHVPENSTESNNAIPIAIRLVFLRVGMFFLDGLNGIDLFELLGELDTQAEKFEAHIVIEARWFLTSKDRENELTSSLSTADQTDLNDGKIVKLPKDYSENNWYPQLFILNLCRDYDEEINYSTRKVASQIQIREYRDVYGNFYSKFDLHHFPNDVQELKVSIGSALFDTEVILAADSNRPSGINHEAFIDQQEWKLFNHIQTERKFIKGFLFQNDDDDKLDAPGHEKKRSILNIACHAGYFSSLFFLIRT